VAADWPHPLIETEAPDYSHLADVVLRIFPTVELQHQLLVDNLMRRYRPDVPG
jgi:2-pyrone-4,6-dicarboxylate lactonase